MKWAAAGVIGKPTAIDDDQNTAQAREATMCKTIKQRVKFKAAPATVYDLLADSRKHTAVTGRKATISRKIGGTFSTGGNDVTGVNVDLVPARRIVQTWRHRRFPEGVFSMAAITLTPTPDGGTELVPFHSVS